MAVSLLGIVEEKTSAPEANESMRSDSRDVVIFGSFRISSKSSLNASATELIQNFLNFSLSAFSFSLETLAVLGGSREGIAAEGGVGERDGG